MVQETQKLFNNLHVKIYTDCKNFKERSFASNVYILELIVPVENIKKDIVKEILLVSMKVTTNTQKENMY